jgi:class 3 adenylate cyclase/pimeloyl-ACP methyl ester carboxylesterase
MHAMAQRTQYARNGGVNIAYQVVGDGPVDVMVIPGFVSHLDLAWADPLSAAFWRRIASFSRLILHDKRGTGLSDPVVGVPPLEQRMEDVHAVLDAVGSERAFLMGISEGGPMSLLFAATYPQRTSGLVLYGSFAKGKPDEEHEGALPRDSLDRVIDAVSNHWGDGSTLELFAPSLAVGEREREMRGVFERASASPGLAAAVIQAVIDIDVTPVLGSVRVPTLVLHRRGDVIPISGGRYIARYVRDAKLIELSGDDHIYFLGDSASILDAIETFVTGTRQDKRPDRVLTTIVFTDLVESTQTAARLGDARWREVLAAHDQVVRDLLRSFGGREVKHTGDGFLATFDGPARAIRCASAISDGVRDQVGVRVRCGVHTGECEVIGDDVGGMTVHIAARIAALAQADEVLVSRTVRDLVVGSEISFNDRGRHTLKGAPDEWHLLAVADPAHESKVGTKTAPERLGPRERLVLTTARHAPWLARYQAGRAFKRAERHRRPTA